MNRINNIKDDYLIEICNIASISALDLLGICEINSYEWSLHTSGLSYGIWVSICDIDEISLDEIDDLINEITISNLN